jgi:hypothetical protein
MGRVGICRIKLVALRADQLSLNNQQLLVHRAMRVMTGPAAFLGGGVGKTTGPIPINPVMTLEA